MAGATFVSKRIARTSTISLKAPLKEVFPLFGPLREKEWADGWEPRILYPRTNEIEERMVFMTAPPYGHDEPNYTWIVSRYLPDQALIEYTVFTPERIWWITIQCREDVSGQTTQAVITYTYIGLTERGNVTNEKTLQHMYAHDLGDWEQALNHYLATGEKLLHR